MSASANIAAYLPAMARAHPDRPAYVEFRWGREIQRSYSFLDQRTDRIARGLRHAGFHAGMRVALMEPQGPKFLALTFGLFKLGAIPVFIDPGLGVRGIGQCLADAQPAAFVGIAKAHFARRLFGWAKDVAILVHTDIRLSRGVTLKTIENLGGALDDPVMANVAPNDQAAILFTSGSTGPAKGVEYSHEMFQQQVSALREIFTIEAGETDLCTFPLFALFAPALGMMSITPRMNAARPAKASPKMLVRMINRFHVANLFGSPALIRNLANYCGSQGQSLTSIKRVISAGAPVSAAIIAQMARALKPPAQVFTPYGATEALPVSVIGSDEILGETRSKTEAGAGICVGRPVSCTEVAIIPISDEPIDDWSKVTPMPTGQIGEISVRGPVVSAAYYNRPEATALSKIPELSNGTFWHRMGDVGYLDDEGRIWFCGRKSHRVVTSAQTYFSIPCEAVFSASLPRHPRTALVGIPSNNGVQPAICVEWHGGKPRIPNFEDHMKQIAAQHAHTTGIGTFLCYPKGFPVDIRHNAKINREKLAVWAARQLR